MLEGGAGEGCFDIFLSPIALAVGAGGGCLDILLREVSIFSLLFLPLSGKRPDIGRNIASKDR